MLNFAKTLQPEITQVCIISFGFILRLRVDYSNNENSAQSI